MPPSPAMRCSPGREPRADNHKRGRSLESGVPLKQRDDDLALFNEVQNRERDNFLLQGDDDFEDIFANKLRHFSDYKLGINIPARGESSDLLHAEDEKNDYEWLITPPETPLFPSLDDEAPQFNLAQRGRTRTQPISISRSPTMEKGRRSSRGSASPNRVSLSPRSHNSTFEGRHRASSAASASPPATLRHNNNTPPAYSHRSPPPSRKPSSPVPRASTPPPPRRLSTGSTNGTTTTTKGIRGNSASPKVKAWQSSIPGFSTEVPPNLRTSLADRPASYVRGSSPASRSSRQSMSPTASRSIGSSHSHERDRFSSHSKGSVGSSAEDDMESLSSVLVVVGRPNSRRVGVGGFQNNKASPSKKPIRTISSSSAPKRSFDLALRQMDHRKGQNMFRPLLSSVPSSTFHAGIATSPYHPVISRNSSVTTSSNASSGVAISGAHDPDHEASQDDATSGYVKVQDDDHDVDVDVDHDGNDDDDDDTSSGSSSPLKDSFHPQNVVGAISSKYPTHDFKSVRGKGGPSGYLKVKGQVENAAITAVKRQLGRQYREDGPPLGIEFEALPPGAFENPVKIPVNQSYYVGDRSASALHSSDGSRTFQPPNASKMYERYNPKSYNSMDLDNSPLDIRHASKHREKHFDNQYINNNNNNNKQTPHFSKNRHSQSMEVNDDSAEETSIHDMRDHFETRIKHVHGHAPVVRRQQDSVTVSNRHLIGYGKNINHNIRPPPKVNYRDRVESLTSDLTVKRGEFLELEDRGMSRKIPKDEEFDGERRGIDEYSKLVSARIHPGNEMKVTKRSREEFLHQMYPRKDAVIDMPPRTIMTKRPPAQMTSSFSDDETAENTSSAD